MRAWLAAPGPLGVTRGRWALALLACIGVALVYRPAAAWLGLLPLLGAPRRHPDPPDPPDPARDALRGHVAARETDRALAGVAAESAAREAQGREAAATDPIAEVRARVEGRARR